MNSDCCDSLRFWRICFMCEEQMVRGGKLDSRKNFKKKFRSKDKGSDDSDEDYVVSSDGVSEGSDENYGSYLDENASGEDNFVVEEEQQQRKKVRKGVGPKARKAFSSCNARKKNGRERQSFSYQEEDDGDEDCSVDDDNDYEVEEEQEEEDVDVDEEVEDEDEDEDFMLEEEDFSDEEKPIVRKRATNLKRGREGVRKSTDGKFCKKRKPKAAKKPSRNKRRKKSGSRTLRNSDDDDDFSDSYCVVTRRKKAVSKRKNHGAQVDLDTFLSGSSDYEYTISEEEREQMREAEKLCYHLRNRGRTVPSPPRTEEYDLRQQRKPRPSVRKGKEKVEEVKAEVIKQVCGICLSEEDKRRVRGTLNCCSHFFCFSCIMEWAKVESRCPLCKQRFQTISKPAKSTVGIDLREVVINVPERDQVYQPSEEELRSYLDPYENVICIECQQGGDDNLMLLCDVCDSPAHTYCVGLAREVPEGNWYCIDCTTYAQGSSSPQPPNRLSDRRTANTLFNRTFPAANREGLDLNSLSSHRTPNIQGFGNIPSPRLPVEVQSTSPMSQAIAPTLERRRILRLHINNLRSSNQMGLVNTRSDGVSAGNPCVGGTLSSQMGQGRETTAENTTTQDTAILRPTLFGENLIHGSPSPLMQHIVFLDSERSHLSRQVFQDSHLSMPIDRTIRNGTILNPLRGLEFENPTVVDRNLNGPELAGVNSESICEQVQIDRYSNVLNTGYGNSSAPLVGDEKDYCAAREHLQPMIESHLKNYLSRDDLGQIAANDIVTEAASTILATCGFKHSINEACRALPPSQCSHIELSMREEQRSLIKGLCSTCFELYVRDVVKKITEESWLNLSL